MPPRGRGGAQLTGLEFAAQTMNFRNITPVHDKMSDKNIPLPMTYIVETYPSQPNIHGALKSPPSPRDGMLTSIVSQAYVLQWC